jgi:peptide deformylase
MTEKMVKPHLEPLPPHSGALNQRAKMIPVEAIASPDTQWIIDEMLDLANGLQGDKKKRTLVGLAAPQVGISKRIIVVDITSTGMGEKPDLRVYVNPTITNRSSTTEIGREGCFSTGNICGIVDRSSDITIEAYDRQGNQLTEQYSGFTARIFQHETDHLDGVRFPDRITDDINLHWVEPDQFGDYREHWRDWDIHCTRQTWEAMKTPE